MAAIYFGGLFLFAFVLLFTVAAVYEWSVMSFKTGEGFIFLPAGLIYIFIGALSFIAIRSYGWEFLLLLVLVIWASDIGAYFFGKILGGPKMAAKISPNKTWAGLAGAVACPVLVCVLFFYLVGTPGMGLGLALLQAALTGLSGQAGDLLISLVKRKAGVKDTGYIIPGHGGVLDRVDALLLGAIVFFSVLALSY